MEGNFTKSVMCEEYPERISNVSSHNQAEKLISNFEKKNTVKFSYYKADKNFGHDGMQKLF